MLFLYVDRCEKKKLATGFVLLIHIFHIIPQVVGAFNVTEVITLVVMSMSYLKDLMLDELQ